MSDSFNGSDYRIINWDSTRVPPNAEPSSPDVSLISASLNTSCSWQTLSTLSSDHLPSNNLHKTTNEATTNPGLRRSYVNLNKAYWDRYRQQVEAVLCRRSLPTNCQRDDNILCTVLPKAAPHHIHTGRHEEHVLSDIVGVMTRRDALHKRDLSSHELPRPNKDIQNRICVHKQKNVELVLRPCTKRQLTKLWRTIQGIDARQRTK